MEERQVTVDGVTYQLGVPFMVIATQNPIEHEGTYPLPEAQRDRFMLELNIGYPTRQAEIEILETHGRTTTLLSDLQPVADAPAVADMIEGAKTVHVADTLKRYIVDLVRATRDHADLALGPARGPPWPCCGRPGPPGPCPGATTWSPTTSRSWSPRSWPTG